MLGIQRMNTDGIAHLREPVCQSPNGWNLGRLNAGMEKRHNPGIPPASCHRIDVFLEIAENDVAVTINENWSRHNDLKRAFRFIVTESGATQRLISQP